MLLPLPLSLRELMPAASLANPESSKDGDAAAPPLRTPTGETAPLSQLQDVLLGLILALSLLSLGCGLWLWLRFRRGAARHAGAVVLASHAPPSEASTPGSTSTFSLPSPPPHAYPPSPHAHRVLVLGSPPDAGGWVIQQKEDPDDEGEKERRRASDDAGSEIYAVDIANGAWAPSPPHGVLYFAGQRLQVLPARPVTPPPSIFVTPPGRSKWSPRRE